MTLPLSKTCPRCGEEKEAAQFGLRLNGRVLKSWCKPCESAWMKSHRPPKAVKDEYDRRYREKHGEEKRARDRAYSESRKEENRIRSATWRKRNPDRRREIVRKSQSKNRHTHAAVMARRRVQQREGLVEKYSRRSVYDRDEGVCQICYEQIDWALSGWDQMGFTVDHRVPVSRGGVDTLSNVRSAHRMCNTNRGIRISAGIVKVRKRNVS